MATREVANVLHGQITEALAFKGKSLESRSQWGSISFEKASYDFRRIFEILDHLSVLPLEYLTDAVVTQTQNEVNAIINLYRRIDQFNIEQQAPTHVRDQLGRTKRGRQKGVGSLFLTPTRLSRYKHPCLDALASLQETSPTTCSTVEPGDSRCSTSRRTIAPSKRFSPRQSNEPESGSSPIA